MTLARRYVIALIIVITIASVGVYYTLYVSQSRCIFVPGEYLYVHVVSDGGQAPLAGVSVTGRLMELCPVASTSNPPHPKSTVLSTHDFTTNASGFIPSSELAGWSYSFQLSYAGHTYAFSAQICGKGTSFETLSLPCGAEHGMTSGLGQSVADEANGTQVIQNCAVASWSGTATISS